MSRIGKQPVVIPSGVTVSVTGEAVAVKGPKGELTQRMPSGVEVKVADGRATVGLTANDPQARANYGTLRSLLQNMVVGVTQGYSRSLEIQGVGFRANMQGQRLVMNVGYSHPVEYDVPAGIDLTVKDGTNLSVTGLDKCLVGQVSARIRGFCPPEPYKGKGVRYKDERVRRKAGKTVA